MKIERFEYNIQRNQTRFVVVDAKPEMILAHLKSKGIIAASLNFRVEEIQIIAGGTPQQISDALIDLKTGDEPTLSDLILSKLCQPELNVKELFIYAPKKHQPVDFQSVTDDRSGIVYRLCVRSKIQP